MKFNLDKKYAKISKYVIITAVITYLAIAFINASPSLLEITLDLFSTVLSILSPVIVGMVIAYLLYGPTNSIENFLMNRKHIRIKKRGICRGIGIFVSYITVILILFSIIMGIYFMIGGKISNSTTIANIANTVTGYFANNEISTDSIQDLIANSKLPFADVISDQIGDIAAWLQSFISSMALSTADVLFAIGSNVFSLLISFILSIYFINSHEYFNDLFNKTYFVLFRKSNIGRSIRRAMTVLNNTFSRYIRGQLIEAFIVGVLTTIALMIVGIDYAVVIGIISGICNLIPYVGPAIGMVLASIMALFTGDLWNVVWVLLGMFIVQQIDGNILCPKIVGDIVGLNPAFIIIAILIGGNRYGLLGMLIAVPLAASIKILISEWFNYRFASSYEATVNPDTNINEAADTVDTDIGTDDVIKSVTDTDSKNNDK